jgi:hypothetical protein
MDNLYTLLLIISLSSTSVISIREIHFVIAYIVFVVSLFLYPAAYVGIRSNINADSRILNANASMATKRCHPQAPFLSLHRMSKIYEPLIATISIAHYIEL